MSIKYQKKNVVSLETNQVKEVEVTNADDFIQVAEYDADNITANKFNSSKGLHIENTGDVGLEIQLTTSKWTEGSPDSHTNNTTCLNTLLGAGEKIELPHNRLIHYSTANSSVNGSSYSDAGAFEGTVNSSCLLDEAIDTTETEFTIDDSDWFKIGDYLALDIGDPTFEIVRVASITNATTIVVERGMLGTEGATHAEDEQIHFYYGNHYQNVAHYNATTIAFANASDPTNDTITDSGSNFLSQGFVPFYPITITDSTSNNATYIPSKIVAGTITLHRDTLASLTTESAGDSVNAIQLPVSITDENGEYASSNFFGVGRNANQQPAGITRGSVAFKTYSKGYAKLKFQEKITSSFDTKLSASTAYAFSVQVDGIKTDVSFTVDSSNTKLGGVDGVISKINNAIQDLVEAETIPIGLNVSILDGELCFTSKTSIGSYHGLVSNSSRVLGTASDIIIDAPSSGTTIFGARRFPSYATSIVSKIADDSVLDVNGRTIPNKEEIIIDDGLGHLMLNGVEKGTIDYDTGAFTLYNLEPYQEFVAFANYSSALSGNLETNASYNSGIYKVSARSCNQKVNGKIKITNIGN